MQYERLNDHYQAVHIVDAKTFLKYRLDEAEYKAKDKQCVSSPVPVPKSPECAAKRPGHKNSENCHVVPTCLQALLWHVRGGLL
eukprot:COSAG02_NODE_1865_length_10601_cov_116.823748_3_plen_84_part_00